MIKALTFERAFSRERKIIFHTKNPLCFFHVPSFFLSMPPFFTPFPLLILSYATVHHHRSPERKLSNCSTIYSGDHARRFAIRRKYTVRQARSRFVARFYALVETRQSIADLPIRQWASRSPTSARIAGVLAEVFTRGTLTRDDRAVAKCSPAFSRDDSSDAAKARPCVGMSSRLIRQLLRRLRVVIRSAMPYLALPMNRMRERIFASRTACNDVGSVLEIFESFKSCTFNFFGSL